MARIEIDPNTKYYPINEEAAARAKEMYSWSEYKHGTQTAYYRAEVDKAYEYADSLPDEYAERAYYMANKYAKRLADWYNKLFSIEMRCPSVMIAGASNFPVGKKQKQVAALDKHYALYGEIEAYREKIRNLARTSNAIRSDDANAIEKLKAKIEKLEAYQAKMKDVNAYYRKHGTLKGYGNGEYDDFEIDYMYGVPFAPFKLQNNNAKIRTAKARLKQLEEAKNAAQDAKPETEYKFFTVKENAEIMRLQLFFDGKPDAEIREVVKRNGFKWAPSNKCWQRLLNDNARRALERVVKELEEIGA